MAEKEINESRAMQENVKSGVARKSSKYGKFLTLQSVLGIILKLRTDADTTIGVQEKKTADMHFKTDNMM